MLEKFEMPLDIVLIAAGPGPPALPVVPLAPAGAFRSQGPGRNGGKPRLRPGQTGAVAPPARASAPCPHWHGSAWARAGPQRPYYPARRSAPGFKACTLLCHTFICCMRASTLSSSACITAYSSSVL
jgi:hypothetical protein